MWARAINIALGIWLMAAGSILGYGGLAHTNDVIVGAIVSSMAVIALWEVTRQLRWVNVLLGAWLVIAGWVLGFETVAAINGSIIGAFVVALALVRGKLKEQFGGGWSALWTSDKGEKGGRN